jgi:hypothetical protein
MILRYHASMNEALASALESSQVGLFVNFIRDNLHSNSFLPETSRISSVSAQPKFRKEFRKFFVKPEVSVFQKHAQNFVPKFQLLIPD